jgi:hypothetical protein
MYYKIFPAHIRQIYRDSQGQIFMFQDYRNTNIEMNIRKK